MCVRGNLFRGKPTANVLFTKDFLKLLTTTNRGRKCFDVCTRFRGESATEDSTKLDITGETRKKIPDNRLEEMTIDGKGVQSDMDKIRRPISAKLGLEKTCGRLMYHIWARQDPRKIKDT
ncbi:hypothetical protein CHS0354_041929 [Potamilus streckersoni]|uniref:Uncharacterized protein n=1 Tax=Potamilus streckersoni TaxID=2493646 RepID=A0AAE0W127_9BIVA|nr:hypothetical protein CHS0354_041929 [Potamilus streckersoni]